MTDFYNRLNSPSDLNGNQSRTDSDPESEAESVKKRFHVNEIKGLKELDEKAGWKAGYNSIREHLDNLMVKNGIKSFETGAADLSGLLGAIVQRYPFMKQKGDPTGYVSIFMPAVLSVWPVQDLRLLGKTFNEIPRNSFHAPPVQDAIRTRFLRHVNNKNSKANLVKKRKQLKEKLENMDVDLIFLGEKRISNRIQ